MRKVLTPGSGRQGQTWWALYLQRRRKDRRAAQIINDALPPTVNDPTVDESITADETIYTVSQDIPGSHT
jgi:hypothetical protein